MINFEQMRKEVAAFQEEESPKLGQKRSIEQVDGTEERENSQLKQGPPSPLVAKPEVEKIEKELKENHDDTPNPEIENASTPKQDEKEEEEVTDPSPAESKTTTSTLLTSFHASQEGPLPIEEQFDIQDEASQKIVDNLVS